MKFISRERALKDSFFASHIVTWQQIGNPSKDNDPLEEGEYYDAATDSYRFFSIQELQDIQKREILEFEKIVDPKPLSESKPLGCVVIESIIDDGLKYCSNLVCELLDTYGLELVFVPFYKTNWFIDDEIKDHHIETRRAYSALKKIIDIENYKGAILINDSQKLKEFLNPFFTLIQSNYYSYGFFYAEKMKTVFSFHYSGELWMYCYAQNGLDNIVAYSLEHKLLISHKYSSY